MSITISISDDIKNLTADRGIIEDDIKTVIEHALNGDIYLYSQDKEILAKKRIDNYTVYVKFINNDNVCYVSDIYSHRVNLSDEINQGDK